MNAGPVMVERRKFVEGKANRTPRGTIPPMRRFGRWMLNAAAAISLVLCAATLGLWIESVLPTRHTPLYGGVRFRIFSDSGFIRLCWFTPKVPPTAGPKTFSEVGKWFAALPPESGHSFGPVAIGIGNDLVSPPGSLVYQYQGRVAWALTSDSVLVVAFAAMPGFVILRRVLSRHREQRLRAAGRCVKCGYDLTGNVSGVCPECGQTIKNIVQAK
jgi:hypothetical protein